MNYITLGLVLASMLVVPSSMPAAEKKNEDNCLVYVGTYTGAKSKGIYSGRMNTRDGSWTALELAAELKNPSFLAVHPKGKYLYAVSEVGDAKQGGAVFAYRIEPGTGKLTLLNQQPTGGSAPCHLAIDKSGQCLIVANYGSGSVSAYPVEADGSLGATSSFVQHEGSSVNPHRQKEPHAHGIAFDRDHEMALVADLGMDKVLGYKVKIRKAEIDFDVAVTAVLKPGAGPRHVAIHPNGHFFYVVDELDSTVSVFSSRTMKGVINPQQSLSSLPPDFHGESFAAELEIHPTGKFLYASNRGHNSISVFQIDGKSGNLTWSQSEVCPGKTPRHFKIDPTGRFLYAALQDSDLIATFAIDAATGHLTPTGQKTEVGGPVCVLFVPTP